MIWKIAVVGSRDYSDRRQVEDYIDSLPPDTVIISGGARGVDTWAVLRARKRRMDVIVLNANWTKHGKAAGMIRNAEIVNQADKVVAFWDGSSAGTLNTINRATKAGKFVKSFSPGEPIE